MGGPQVLIVRAPSRPSQEHAGLLAEAERVAHEDATRDRTLDDELAQYAFSATTHRRACCAHARTQHTWSAAIFFIFLQKKEEKFQITQNIQLKLKWNCMKIKTFHYEYMY